MIISIGYRVKSQNGVIFRKWANQVLKDYMIKGYAVNQKRLEYLEKTVKLIDIANRIDEKLENNDAQEILKTIIENIYQTFDNNEVYKSIEEKASNFLYMIIKDHVFINGAQIDA